LTCLVNRARVWVDMELGQHIDTNAPRWYRCQRVEINGDVLKWELNQERAYDVLRAYQDGPHREFIEASTDGALRVFVRRWGPLWPSGGTRTGCHSIKAYRKQRDQLSAFVQLLEAIENASERRQALLAVLRVCEDPPEDLDFFFYAEPLLRGIPRDRRAWCENAFQSEIDELCIHIVNKCPFSWVPLFKVERHGRGEIVRVSLLMTGLLEALIWMVWQDVFLKRPFRFCVECGALIKCETKHKRRFCDNPKTNCARRKTDRDWKRKKRAKEKKQRSSKRAMARLGGRKEP
jgi:hypothetical protein